MRLRGSPGLMDRRAVSEPIRLRGIVGFQVQ
jgi:hypothetical protein